MDWAKRLRCLESDFLPYTRESRAAGLALNVAVRFGRLRKAASAMNDAFAGGDAGAIRGARADLGRAVKIVAGRLRALVLKLRNKEKKAKKKYKDDFGTVAGGADLLHERLTRMLTDCDEEAERAALRMGVRSALPPTAFVGDWKAAQRIFKSETGWLPMAPESDYFRGASRMRNACEALDSASRLDDVAAFEAAVDLYHRAASAYANSIDHALSSRAARNYDYARFESSFKRLLAQVSNINKRARALLAAAKAPPTAAPERP